MTFQQYLIRLSQKESHTTYLTRLRSHPDLTPHPEMEILTELKHAAGGFWGQTELGWACYLSTCIYL